MRRIRLTFELDLDVAFVFGSLAHLNLNHKLHPNLPTEDAATRKKPLEFRAARLRDVVQVTSLPRETVRRYLLKLEQDQKVHQPEAGKWSIRADAIRPDMALNTVQTIKKLLHTAEESRMQQS